MILFDKDCQLSYNRIKAMLWNSCLLCYFIFTDDNLVLSVVYGIKRKDECYGFTFIAQFASAERFGNKCIAKEIKLVCVE